MDGVTEAARDGVGCGRMTSLVAQQSLHPFNKHLLRVRARRERARR